MSYQEHAQLGHHAGRTKKKSDDFIKRRLEKQAEAKKDTILPKHAIKPPELADKSFVLPKIPLKSAAVNPPPPIQLAMAEIIEDADKEHENHTREEEINPEIQSRPGPELNLENVLKSLPLFAEQIKEKRSLSPLIKILVPSLESQTVIITMTRQQEELLGDTKIQWQAFLRQYFNNQAITLQIRIDEQANTKREAYTQDEQFKEMLEENEVFRQLVSKLKLKLKK